MREAARAAPLEGGRRTGRGRPPPGRRARRARDRAAPAPARAGGRPANRSADPGAGFGPRRRRARTRRRRARTAGRRPSGARVRQAPGGVERRSPAAQARAQAVSSAQSTLQYRRCFGESRAFVGQALVISCIDKLELDRLELDRKEGGRPQRLDAARRRVGRQIVVRTPCASEASAIPATLLILMHCAAKKARKKAFGRRRRCSGPTAATLTLNRPPRARRGGRRHYGRQTMGGLILRGRPAANSTGCVAALLSAAVSQSGQGEPLAAALGLCQRARALAAPWAVAPESTGL
jgi:hypothetical protein